MMIRFLILFLIFLASGQKVLADAFVPAPPKLAASSWILMDAHSGDILTAHNEHEELPPASLTKMMTAYIAAEAIDSGRISYDDLVPVSVKAWRMGGSRMFIREGTQVPLIDLMKGIIIQSGNDASVAVAEYVAGSEDSFVDLMNQHAARLGMTHTHFMNATGWPAENHYSTAYDMALLARAIILDHPNHYPIYKEKSFTYNGIPQNNRNTLLWKDPDVDGLKTGHTEEAGYCLVASAQKNGMRLISVVMGTDSDRARSTESGKLLTWGFRFFETHEVYHAAQKLADAKLWYAAEKTVPVGPADDVVVTIPRDSADQLVAELQLPGLLKGPVKKGQQLGTIRISLNGDTIKEVPAVALNAVDEAGLFTRILHALMLFFINLFS